MVRASSSPARSAAWCAAAMAAVGALSIAFGAPLLFPAVGASAFLAFGLPASPLGSVRNAAWGHAIGLAFGSAAALAFGVERHAPWLAGPEPWAAVAASTLALAGATWAMLAAGVPHPPAGATTLIFATGLLGGVRDAAAVLLSVGALWSLHAARLALPGLLALLDRRPRRGRRP